MKKEKNSRITVTVQKEIWSQVPEACRSPLQDAMRHPGGLGELIESLRSRLPKDGLLGSETSVRGWEACGVILKNVGRLNESALLFETMYSDVNSAEGIKRADSSAKGTALIWLSDIHFALGHPALSQRYLALTLCEDIVGCRGDFEATKKLGGYWRAVSKFGMSDSDVRSLTSQIWSQFERAPNWGRFPEWTLQQVDDSWRTLQPSVEEGTRYDINQAYALKLLGSLGDNSGDILEILAEYLLGAIPGWRTKRRVNTYSTDYDVVCSVEGHSGDFREDIGRFVICECKDWKEPAGFTTIAKFARVLQSAKCRCGVLFSCNGVSGRDKTRDAAREILKVFQDTGTVILVLDRNVLERVTKGENLIKILRQGYERVRLDLRQ